MRIFLIVYWYGINFRFMQNPFDSQSEKISIDGSTILLMKNFYLLRFKEIAEFISFL